MNLILSLIVSLALMFSPTGSLPAQPDTAVTWTLSNVSLDLPQGSVTLNPALRLSRAVGSEEAQLHFEVINGDNTLMPISGRLTEEDLTFSLGKSGNAYRITNEDLVEMLYLGDNALDSLDAVGNVFRDYFALLSREMHDETFAVEGSEAVFKALIESTGAETVQTEMEVDGAMIPAERIEINLTGENMFQFMDAIMNCGVPEIENFFRSYLKIFPLLGMPIPAEELTSYAQVYELIMQDDAEELETLSFPMTITAAVQDDATYAQMQTNFELDGEGMSMNMDTVTRGEETTLEMNLDLNMADTYAGYKIEGGYTGPANAPTQMAYDCYVTTSTTTREPVVNDAGETEWVEMTEEFYITASMESATKDGLTSGSVTMSVDTPIDETTAVNMGKLSLNFDETREADGSVTGAYGLNVDMMGTNMAFNLNHNQAERKEADGSVTTSHKFNFSSNMMADEVGVSFDLNRAEGPVADLFEGVNVYDLKDISSAMYAEEVEAMDPGAMNLMSDIMGLSSDAMYLFSDESMMELTNLFAGSVDEAAELPGDLAAPELMTPAEDVA